MIKPILCCLLVTACAFAQSAKPVSYQGTTNLVALERMWNEAQVNRDSTAIASMIGDRFTNTEFDGEVSNRGKFLADFADPKFKPSLMNIQNVQVEMYPNTAVVTGDQRCLRRQTLRALRTLHRYLDLPGRQVALRRQS
jgi:hypothetical protein